MVVADACGTKSTLGDVITYASLWEIGVRVTVVNTAVSELVYTASNFLTPAQTIRSAMDAPTACRSYVGRRTDALAVLR